MEKTIIKTKPKESKVKETTGKESTLKQHANAKTALLEERVLAAMAVGVSYTSTAIRDALKIEQKSGRSLIRHVMRKLEKDGKITITPVKNGEQKKFTYQRK